MKILISIAVVSIGVLLAKALADIYSGARMILSVLVCLALISLWLPGGGHKRGDDRG